MLNMETKNGCVRKSPVLLKTLLILMSTAGGFFGFSSCAQEEDPGPTQEILETPPAQLASEGQACALSKEFVTVFQAEMVSGDDKTELIDYMNHFPQDCLQKLLAQKTEKELLLLTVWDLTRHSVQEMAEKAKALAQKFDTASWISEEIASEDASRQEEVTAFLLRIESVAAQDLLAQAELKEEDKAALQSALQAETPRVLIPTGSEKGERYYVRAVWDPESEQQVNCLADLFHKVLLARRSVEEERQIMETRRENPHRSAYWYSKDWALKMAETVESCDATASFMAMRIPRQAPPPASQPQPAPQADSPPQQETAPPDPASQDSAQPAPQADSHPQPAPLAVTAPQSETAD